MVSHTFTVRSRLADASRFPSGLNATLVTSRVCPFNVRVACPPIDHLKNLRPLIGQSGGIGLFLVRDRAVVTFLSGHQQTSKSHGNRDQARDGSESRNPRSAANPKCKVFGGLFHGGTLASFLND